MPHILIHRSKEVMLGTAIPTIFGTLPNPSRSISAQNRSARPGSKPAGCVTTTSAPADTFAASLAASCAVSFKRGLATHHNPGGFSRPSRNSLATSNRRNTSGCPGLGFLQDSLSPPTNNQALSPAFKHSLRRLRRLPVGAFHLHAAVVLTTGSAPVEGGATKRAGSGKSTVTAAPKAPLSNSWLNDVGSTRRGTSIVALGGSNDPATVACALVPALARDRRTRTLCARIPRGSQKPLSVGPK
mmetsp:Transcript_29793/g.65091  ORF Transcript_29793/g.65091 Transcript_29793/m.65091 type:complete len:243 (-) Transcript_29793:81-809(-)